MSKWVCITNDLIDFNFTYGKIYEGKDYDNLLSVINDLGEKKLVQYYNYSPIENFEGPKELYGTPIRRDYFFMDLKEWRNNKINKII